METLNYPLISLIIIHTMIVILISIGAVKAYNRWKEIETDRKPDFKKAHRTKNICRRAFATLIVTIIGEAINLVLAYYAGIFDLIVLAQ